MNEHSFIFCLLKSIFMLHNSCLLDRVRQLRNHIDSERPFLIISKSIPWTIHKLSVVFLYWLFGFLVFHLFFHTSTTLLRALSALLQRPLVSCVVFPSCLLRLFCFWVFATARLWHVFWTLLWSRCRFSIASAARLPQRCYPLATRILCACWAPATHLRLYCCVFAVRLLCFVSQPPAFFRHAA